MRDPEFDVMAAKAQPKSRPASSPPGAGKPGRERSILRALLYALLTLSTLMVALAWAMLMMTGERWGSGVAEQVRDYWFLAAIALAGLAASARR